MEGETLPFFPPFFYLSMSPFSFFLSSCTPTHSHTILLLFSPSPSSLSTLSVLILLSTQGDLSMPSRMERLGGRQQPAQPAHTRRLAVVVVLLLLRVFVCACVCYLSTVEGVVQSCCCPALLLRCSEVWGRVERGMWLASAVVWLSVVGKH
mmetsp:Transcript_16096/g.40686  ORF Transcript_16096/g.40686 Transcript_16096/m.40686 type:complete len:151 (-) Transcript_16096:145-597(-)